MAVASCPAGSLWRIINALILIWVERCRNLKIEGVTVCDPGLWSVNLVNSDYVQVQNLKVIGSYVNSDGVAVGGTSHVTVRDSFCHNADDAFEVKGWIPMTDVTFSNCVCWSDVGICFGLAWDVPASVSNVWFKNCTVIHDLAATTAQPAVGMCVIVDPGSVPESRIRDPFRGSRSRTS